MATAPAHRVSYTLRSAAAVLCLVVGALGLLVGAVLSDAARLLRPDIFADRAAASLADPRVAPVAAEVVVDALLAQQPDLTAVRPLLLAAAEDLVGSRAARGIARPALRSAYGALVSDAGRSVVLSLPDLAVVARAALARTDEPPGAVPTTLDVDLAALRDHPAMRTAAGVIRAAPRIGRGAWGALAGGAALLLGGVLLAADRRRALVGAGAALLVIGTAAWLVVPAGGLAVRELIDDPARGAAAAGLWTAALGGLTAWGLGYSGVGVVFTAAGLSLQEGLDLAAVGRRARALLLEPPRRPWVRIARALTAVAAAVVLALAPSFAASLLAVGAALVLAFAGLHELFAAVRTAAPGRLPPVFGRAARHDDGREATPHATPAAPSADAPGGWATGGVLVVVLAALFAGGIAFATRSSAESQTPTTIDACNGAAVLCTRRLDEVVLAGTHNAMASADQPSWLFPAQERGLVAQLDDGVRALLIDVHHGTPVDGSGTGVGAGVRSNLTDGAMQAEAERVLGPEGTAAATRIRDRLVGEAAGPRGLYLCHGFCELGAAPLDSALGAVRAFLTRHPNEVIVLVVEDYVPPRELAGAFEASRLAELVYRGPAGTGWPTLRELIARDERVVVFIESGKPGVPWLRPAFEAMQETPYTFRSAGDTLSCAPNRGGRAGTLFLVNHWIETTPAPRPSNAARVNALDVLLERAERCQRARGRLPNILAVDFYRTGDVLRAARVLNGLATRPSPTAAAD